MPQVKYTVISAWHGPFAHFQMFKSCSFSKLAWSFSDTFRKNPFPAIPEYILCTYVFGLLVYTSDLIICVCVCLLLIRFCLMSPGGKDFLTLRGCGVPECPELEADCSGTGLGPDHASSLLKMRWPWLIKDQDGPDYYICSLKWKRLEYKSKFFWNGGI